MAYWPPQLPKPRLDGYSLAPQAAFADRSATALCQRKSSAAFRLSDTTARESRESASNDLWRRQWRSERGMLQSLRLKRYGFNGSDGRHLQSDTLGND